MISFIQKSLCQIYENARLLTFIRSWNVNSGVLKWLRALLRNLSIKEKKNERAISFYFHFSFFFALFSQWYFDFFSTKGGVIGLKLYPREKERNKRELFVSIWDCLDTIQQHHKYSQTHVPYVVQIAAVDKKE